MADALLRSRVSPARALRMLVSRTIKRTFDLIVTALVLVLISPLLLAVALLVWATMGRPILYGQLRPGLDERPFRVWKFRTMTEERDAAGQLLPDGDRLTPLGRWMRQTSLDELPQLVNVLMGEMSLVGPRPERPHFVEQFSREVPRYGERHNEKAGMTGWAQVNGLRGNTSITERTKYDLFYVENWSLAFDVKILLKTIGAIFRDKNAY